MARYRGPVCRICRREGQKLFLKGTRCYSNKCVWDKKDKPKAYPPGMFGEAALRRRRPSDYGIQLREKQKLRATYGVLEKPFRSYVKAADRMDGVAGENLLKLLELRLDNVVYRAGFASSRAEARQLVSHRHFSVNDRIVDIPSMRLRPGDVVKVREKSRNVQPIAASIARGRGPLNWLSVDEAHLTATVVSVPERAEIDTDVNEQMIIEYYSR